jgi:hypothetical protein
VYIDFNLGVLLSGMVEIAAPDEILCTFQLRIWRMAVPKFPFAFVMGGWFLVVPLTPWLRFICVRIAYPRV